MRSKAWLAAGLLAIGCCSVQTTWAEDETNHSGNIQPDGRGNRLRGSHPRHSGGTGQPNSTGNGINYNGGPVILGTTHIYFIWYGTWDASSQTILTNWANHIGGSPYFAINTTYFNASNQNVTNAVTFNASTTDNYSQGTSLSDAAIWAIVSSAISSGRLPLDTNGVYFVLTAAGVQETSGFLTQYCGWHTYNMLSNQPVQYAFIGNASGPSLGACSVETVSSPNPTLRPTPWHPSCRTSSKKPSPILS